MSQVFPPTEMWKSLSRQQARSRWPWSVRTIKFNGLDWFKTSRSRDLLHAAPTASNGYGMNFKGTWVWCMTHRHLMVYIYAKYGAMKWIWSHGWWSVRKRQTKPVIEPLAAAKIMDRYICSCYHSSVVTWNSWLKFFFLEIMTLKLLHCQYNKPTAINRWNGVHWVSLSMRGRC